MKKSCAFLTMEDPTGFVVEDELAVGPLAELGWAVRNVPWAATGIDWSEFDAVIIRSTWDYQKSPDRFLKTLETIEAADTRLFNPLSICRWNLHKSYLRELLQKGVPIVPTTWHDRIDKASLARSFDEAESDRIIVKPVIGANADDTFLLRRDDPANWKEALEVFANSPLMLQPFIDSVLETGEYSLFYFANNFSHAVIKKPRQGDFRVQEEHGGTVRAVQPSEAMLHVGKKIMATLDQTLLYARIDLVLLDNTSPALIELELIEPSLHFSCDPESTFRFATALDTMAI